MAFKTGLTMYKDSEVYGRAGCSLPLLSALCYTCHFLMTELPAGAFFFIK